MTDRAKNYGNNPAFPTGQLKIGDFQGMTRRDLFAAMAMQGLLAQTPCRVLIGEIVKESVQCADALLEELSKTDKTE